VPVDASRATHDDEEEEDDDDAYEDVEGDPPTSGANRNLSMIVEQSGLYSDDMDFSFDDGELSAGLFLGI